MHIYIGGKDQICPIDGDELIDRFTTKLKPEQVTFDDWDQQYFVKGKDLDKLVSKIVTALEKRPRNYIRKSYAELTEVKDARTNNQANPDQELSSQDDEEK